jgi:dienelactone hydrolase
MKLIVSVLAVWMSATLALGEVKTEVVEYADGDVKLKGFIAYDPALSSLRPGVLVVHEWWGLDDYAKSRAKQLAELGYVALAVDMYGDGKVTDEPKQAGEWAGALRSDRQKLRQRAQAGLEALKQRQNVDQQKLAAIGYCFGGTTVLELARGGADLDAVVSFHGGLSTPSPANAGAFDGTILVCHGGIDPMVKPDEVQAFLKEMNNAKLDYIFMAFAGADHSFTNPQADQRNIPGISYNETADQRSWIAMRTLFERVFSK